MAKQVVQANRASISPEIDCEPIMPEEKELDSVESETCVSEELYAAFRARRPNSVSARARTTSGKTAMPKNANSMK